MTKGIRVAEQICTLLGIRIAERSQSVRQLSLTLGKFFLYTLF